MTKTSQKGEASTYRIWKRQSTAYGSVNLPYMETAITGQLKCSLKYSWKISHIVERSITIYMPQRIGKILLVRLTANGNAVLF